MGFDVLKSTDLDPHSQAVDYLQVTFCSEHLGVYLLDINFGLWVSVCGIALELSIDSYIWSVARI